MDKPLSPQGVAASRPMPSKSSAPYPFYLGGLATALAGTITHPLDLTKVRLQTMDPKPGMVAAMRQCVRADGLRGLFEGISATWFRAMSYSLVRFWAFDFAKEKLVERSGTPPTVWTAIAAGTFAGVIGGVVSNPGDMVLIRMQADHAKPLAERYGYKNAVHGLFRMVKDEGVAQLGRSLNLTVFRAILTNTGQLASYDVAKRYLTGPVGMSEGIGLHFLASTFAGTVGTTISQPADVIRSRLMAASRTGTRANPLTVTKHLVATEGMASLFRGYVPTWSRQTPQTILTFIFLEQLRIIVDGLRGQVN